jgi:hypothetical protein
VAYAMSDPQWCLRESQRIGLSCHGLVQHLFSDRVLDHLRAAQALIRLEAKFGAARLETACARALAFDAPRYRDVKAILQKGLDQQPDCASHTNLSETYTRGGRFCRDSQTLLRL